MLRVCVCVYRNLLIQLAQFLPLTSPRVTSHLISYSGRRIWRRPLPPLLFQTTRRKIWLPQTLERYRMLFFSLVSFLVLCLSCVARLGSALHMCSLELWFWVGLSVYWILFPCSERVGCPRGRSVRCATRLSTPWRDLKLTRLFTTRLASSAAYATKPYGKDV